MRRIHNAQQRLVVSELQNICRQPTNVVSFKYDIVPDYQKTYQKGRRNLVGIEALFRRSLPTTWSYLHPLAQRAFTQELLFECSDADELVKDCVMAIARKDDDDWFLFDSRSGLFSTQLIWRKRLKADLANKVRYRSFDDFFLHWSDCRKTKSEAR